MQSHKILQHQQIHTLAKRTMTFSCGSQQSSTAVTASRYYKATKQYKVSDICLPNNKISLLNQYRRLKQLSDIADKATQDVPRT